MRDLGAYDETYLSMRKEWREMKMQFDHQTVELPKIKQKNKAFSDGGRAMKHQRVNYTHLSQQFYPQEIERTI